MNMNNVPSSSDIRHRLFEERSDERPSTKGQGPANKANEDPSAFRFCTGLSQPQDLGAVNATVQMVQKHLEKKRIISPRFRFLSNDRLFGFLAKADASRRIRTTLCGCGPHFYDICIWDNCNANTDIFTSSFGRRFTNDTGLDGTMFFTSSGNFQVKETEVFEIID
jgi:hypothetical protein